MAYQVFSSEKVSLGTIVTLPISPEYAHCFAGIRYFNSNDEQITPDSGTITVTAQHLTNNHFDEVTNALLDASLPGSEAEWGGNVTFARATPDALTGTDLATFQLVVVQNLS